MSKQAKGILQYVGDDGEFLYPVDEHGQFNYSNTMNYPPNVDYAEVPLYTERETSTNDPGIAIGCIMLSFLAVYFIIMFIALMSQ